MNIEAYKTKAGHFPAKFPQEIKADGRLEYFVKGKGYKKTKVFSEVVIDLPDTLDNPYDIKTAFNVYGESIARLLITNEAEYWQDGVLALSINHTNWLASLQELNVLLEVDNLFKLCGRGILFGIPILDVVELDRYLRSKDLDFEPMECTYKGKNISTKEYVLMKYGDRAIELIHRLIGQNTTKNKKPSNK